jgi:hypothetical protein
MAEATQGIYNKNHTDNATPDVSEVAVPSIPDSCQNSNLLDSNLDEIQVPALLPLITRQMPGPATTLAITRLAEERHLGGPAPLLNGGLDDLAIPALKSESVSCCFPGLPSENRLCISRSVKLILTFP